MKERGDKMVRRSFFRRNKKNPSSNQKENFTIKIGNDLEKNLSNVKNMLDDADDLIIRQFTSGSHKLAIVCLEGLVDKEFVQTHVIRNLQETKDDLPDPAQTLDVFFQKLISLTSIEYAESLDDISYGLLSGNTVLYLNGINQVLVLGTSGGKTREIQEPVSESLIRGPRDGFVEDIQTNISLLRRYIRDPNLRFKSHEIGRRSKQKLVVAFMDGITDQDLVKEVNRRLETIDIDFAPESGFVEQWIEDSF
ncbi:spore germination protein, partial [Virgibacillus halodenitrificans]|nr:spore germination protein [Virgibacillus halodenitrificans]